MERSFPVRTRVPDCSAVALIGRPISEKEILRRSVCAIRDGSLYYRDSMHPNDNGLLSSSMGIIDDSSQKLCQTDHLPMKLTPGFSGHLELPMYFFHPPALKPLIRFLKRICFSCGALLVNMAYHEKTLLALPLMERLTAIDKSHKFLEECCPRCGLQQPKKIDQDEHKDHINHADLRLTFYDAEFDKLFYVFRSPDEIYELLGKVDSVTKVFLGIYNESIDIRNALTRYLLISPPQIRPTVRQNSTVPAEDDQTTLYFKIYQACRELTQALEARELEVATAITTGQQSENVLDRLRATGATDMDINSIPDMSPEAWLEWVMHPPPRTQVECQISEIRSRIQSYIFLIYTSSVKGASALMPNRKRLTTTKERADGKQGHMRQHVNGKRVDKSARTIVIGNNNIPANKVGVPKTIMQSITVVEIVNTSNYAGLLKLVRNGPRNYPGAKYIMRSNGVRICLDKKHAEVELFIGDSVVRHILPGDCFTDNRQPTLHKNSHMAHFAMLVETLAKQISTSVVECYNADFDGDEMNLHIAILAAIRAEYRSLMLVAYNMTSPANGTMFVSCTKQDTMIGIYLFTDPTLRFTYEETMSLISCNPNVSMRRLFRNHVDTFHPYELLSLLFPDTFSFLFESDQPDQVVEIRCGQMIRGRITKPVLMQHTRGILHRLYHDFGGFRCCEFVDQVLLMMRQFLMMRGFSMGMEDLLYDVSLESQLHQMSESFRAQWEGLNQQVYEGKYHGKGLYSAAQRYEHEILNLGNQHQANVQSLVRQSMSERNRLYQMIHSGARGKMVNCAQLVAMYGQQLENGGRIQMNFTEGRTGPHFYRYDLHPEARGYIDRSFIEGLNPQQFMHSAIGARENQIGTSVGTSKTGYLQRRITKFMEDLVVWYDQSVRTSDGRVVQLRFGGIGLDISKLEYVRLAPLLQTESQLRQHFLQKPEDLDISEPGAKVGWSHFLETQQPLLQQFLDMRRLYFNKINVTDGMNTRITSAECAVSFEAIWYQELQLELRDRTGPVPKARCLESLREYATIVQDRYMRLFEGTWYSPPPLFRLLFFYYLSPLQCWAHQLAPSFLERVIDRIRVHYLRSLSTPGELIGQTAGQALGCNTTQMSLNSIHIIGGNMQMGERLTGSKRTDEILTKTTTKFSSMTIFPRFVSSNLADQEMRMIHLGAQLMYTKLEHAVLSATLDYSPNGGLTSAHPEDQCMIERFLAYQRRCPPWMWDPPKHMRLKPLPKKTAICHWCPWVIRLVLRPDMLYRLNMTTQDVHALLYQKYREDIQCLYSDTNHDQLIFRISLRMSCLFPSKTLTTPSTQEIMEKLKKEQDSMLSQLVLCGIPGIHGIGQREMTRVVMREGQFVEEKQTVLETNGSSLLQVLSHPDVDAQLTWTNDVHETYSTLGFFAARTLMIRELRQTIGATSDSNISLLVDRMMLTGMIMPVTRAGIKEHRDFTTKLSFETQSAIMTETCFGGDVDFCRAPAAQVMFAKEEANYGTSMMRLALDLDHPNVTRRRLSKEAAMARKQTMAAAAAAANSSSDTMVVVDTMATMSFHPLMALFQRPTPWMHLPKLCLM